MHFPIIMRILFLICLALLLEGGPAFAGEEGRFLYQWTDGQGNVGVADDLTKVPQQYRAGARRVRQPGAADPEDPGQDAREMRQQAAQESRQEIDSTADADEIKKAEWQQKVYDAKRRVADAEGRVNDLERRKAELMTQWGGAGAALPPQHVLDEIAKIEADKVQARKDMDKANDDINVNIPDQARKAGIPPGWLREVK